MNSILLILGFVVGIYQINKASDLLLLQAMGDRLDAFLATEQPINEEHLAVMKAVPEDYFDLEIYAEKYEHDDDRLRRYLMRTRHYHFLLYATAAEGHFEDLFNVELETWIRELMQDEEFYDYHRSQASYYPEFSSYLEQFAPSLFSPGSKTAPRRSSSFTDGEDSNTVIRVSTLGCILLGVVIASAQLRKFNRLFELQTLSDRFGAYESSEAPVTDAQVEMMLLLRGEYFDEDLFERRYEHDPERCKRYLLMLRRYHYALYSWWSEKRLPIFFGVDTKQWFRELCDFEEFRDVHARYKRYYGGFPKAIDLAVAESRHRREQSGVYETKYLTAGDYRRVIDKFCDVNDLASEGNT